jgi:superfamily II DNA/RNA helicase
VDPQQTRKWGLEYKRAIVHDVYRNDLVRAHVAIATKPCLVLVQEKEHGERLRKLFEADDVRFVTGDDPATYRTEVLRDFNVGKFPILIGTPIFEEGVDIPNLATLVNAAGFKSEILSIQRLGRCVRRAPGKTSFTVVDFEDRGHPWFTEHSQARADTYAELGFHVYGMKTKVTPEDLEERRELEAVLLPKRGVPAGWNHRGLATAKPDPEADRKAEILQGAQTLWSTFKVMATFMLCGGVLLLILGWLYGSCVGEGL